MRGAQSLRSMEIRRNRVRGLESVAVMQKMITQLLSCCQHRGAHDIAMNISLYYFPLRRCIPLGPPSYAVTDSVCLRRSLNRL